MNSTIWVAGDYIVDRFVEGKLYVSRFEVENIIVRPGGAGNTFNNLATICQKNDIGLCQLAGHRRELTRYVMGGQTVLEAWDAPQDQLSSTPTDYAHSANTVLNRITERVRAGKATWNTLVVSEYNKGAANFQPDNPDNIHAAPGIVDLLVVDSRYRTVHPNILKMGKTSIWRCTGLEYDEEFSHNFDWVVWTNHDRKVRIIEVGMLGQPVHINVPYMKVVDTVGAGDTFTAALAAHLTKAREISWDTILSAAHFAVGAAQDVCKKPYTAVTDVIME